MAEENTPQNPETEKKLSKKERRKIKRKQRKQKKQKKEIQEIKLLPAPQPQEKVNPSTEKILEEENFSLKEIRKASPETRKKPGFWWYFFRIFFLSLAFLILAFCCAAVAIFLIWGRDLPDVRDLKNKPFAETTVIYDRNGNVLYKVFGEENRKYVPLSQINQKVIDATISIEDKNFYSHLGFDPIGMIRAQLNNFQDDSSLQGASTITQQLAKNLYLTPERTLSRKIKELILAMEIEWDYSKDEILELYLNKIPYGSNAYGIEAAANTYFKKTSSELNLTEAAILASLPKAPSKYSPYGDGLNDLMGYCKVASCSSPDDDNYIWGRKDLVLKRMLDDGKINKDEFLQAWKEGLTIKFQNPQSSITAPHFVLYVKDYLENKYGKDFVENGGLSVTTTLDLNLQKEAEQIIRDKYDSNVKAYGANNAAEVSLDPKTGQILTMVGSADYWNNAIDGQVNMVTSYRQPGSSFKPLVYAAAIENAGIGSGTILGDYRTKFDADYIPVDSDNNYAGKMNVRTALSNSRNIPAIKAWYLAGGEKPVLDFVTSLGVTSLRSFEDNYNSNPNRHWDFSYGPAMAIGAGEIQLLELADAYSTFADNGKFNPANPILEIKDRDGKIIEQFQDQGQQVMRPETAYIINSILSDILARPAGSWRNVLTITGQNLAAKTGTSNKLIGTTRYPNNLVTLGYTPTIVSATWVGNTDGRQVSMRAWGEFTAAPINKAFLEFALKDKPLVPYDIPADIIKVGSEFYPPNWDRNRNYDGQFKPLDKKICTPDEKAKDPEICYSDDELSAMGMNGAEIPLNSGALTPRTGANNPVLNQQQ